MVKCLRVFGWIRCLHEFLHSTPFVCFLSAAMLAPLLVLLSCHVGWRGCCLNVLFGELRRGVYLYTCVYPVIIAVGSRYVSRCDIFFCREDMLALLSWIFAATGFIFLDYHVVVLLSH